MLLLQACRMRYQSNDGHKSICDHSLSPFRHNICVKYCVLDEVFNWSGSAGRFIFIPAWCSLILKWFAWIETQESKLSLRDMKHEYEFKLELTKVCVTPHLCFEWMMRDRLSARCKQMMYLPLGSTDSAVIYHLMSWSQVIKQPSCFQCHRWHFSDLVMFSLMLVFETTSSRFTPSIDQQRVQ